MKIICEKCDGDGEIECGECGYCHECQTCDGEGEIVVCITKYAIPKGNRHESELTEIQRDAIKCKTDHAKLVALNPKAKDSYDKQLESTLAKLNTEASELKI